MKQGAEYVDDTYSSEWKGNDDRERTMRRWRKQRRVDCVKRLLLKFGGGERGSRK